MENEREKRDLVLAPGEYTYMQDVTKGQIKVFTGPTVVNATAQERPVIYVPQEGRFKTVAKLEDALRKSPIAVQGYYLVLKNPTERNEQPSAGSSQGSPDLIIGRKINIHGPVTFSLWPGQDAQMIRGHHLRSNQYLLVRIYDEEAARRNWTKAVVKLTSTGEPKSEQTDVAPSGDVAPTRTQPMPDDLTVGRELIIRGTEVSFYMPPTGISVVQEGNNQFVRDALTLERLEYCILVDEDGNKRYEIGPAVVFPEPSERFMGDKKGNTKFRATELNEVQGLHIKVIADYEDVPDEFHAEGHFRTGEELFVTGRQTTIYFPREEHSLIKYDGRSKHFATAVPAGEGRYVMERISGRIRLERGPQMLLPDPRSEVMVRRVLSDKQCQLWYPGNAETLLYNQELRRLLAQAPSTRQGAVTEGEISRNAARSAKSSLTTSAAPVSAGEAIRGSVGGVLGHQLLASNFVAQMDQSLVSSDAAGMVGDEFSRASTYTQPRTVTLDTKYQGAPSVDVWTGYAVLVVSKTGDRRVEQGPKTVLLEYDESLEMLTLSRGKPKTTAELLHTAYLRVLNNKISDIIEVETRDHVRCLLKLSLRTNFEGDPNRWFSVENYVKYMTDHVRSVLKGAVKRMPVQQFYADHVAIVRDTILGVAEGTVDGVRPGMRFTENGMRVVDIEVLDVKITDATIGGLLTQAQLAVMRSNIELETEQRSLEISRERERVSRERAQAEHETLVFKNQLEIVQLEEFDKVDERKFGLAKAEHERAKEVETAAQIVKDVTQQAELARSKAGADLQLDVTGRQQIQLLERMNAEVESVVARFTAAQAGFSEALLALSNNETLQKVADAWSIQRVIGGQNVSEALHRVFEGTPLAAIAKKLVGSNGAEGKQPVAPAAPTPR